MRKILALFLSLFLAAPAQAQFVSVDGIPLIPYGTTLRQGVPTNGTFLSFTNVDAAPEASIMIGQIVTSDGASHTINTTGSSSLGWMSGTSTVFANGGSTAIVGLAAVDTSNGPPGRAVNVANVITFDVSATFTGGGGGITASAWQESVPTAGTKTIANGDLVAFAVQFTARAGVDVLDVRALGGSGISTGLPTSTSYSGLYINQNLLPNAIITFSDGAKGYFFGGAVGATTTNTTWNSGSAQKEFGNVLLVPFPVKVYGIVFAVQGAANFDAVLYSDPLGTPAAECTVSTDANTFGVASLAYYYLLCPSPVDIDADTPYAVVLKPGASNITLTFKTYGDVSHQLAESGEGYAVSRDTGAFAQQNSGLDRYPIGFLIKSFSSGTGGGGGRIIGGN